MRASSGDGIEGRGADTISRRTSLALLGGAVVGALVSGCGGADEPTSKEPSAASSANERKSYSEWRASLGPRFFVAHRGSGDVLPEHTLPAYQAAFDWGARIMEVSVVLTSDGVLGCLHDLTYDRVTTATGTVRSQSSQTLRAARVNVPRLGPGWQGEHMPPIPLLEDVLVRFGGRMLLCVEAKDDDAYEPMVSMIRRLGLGRSVMIKVPGTTRQLTKAKSDGFPVFGYLAGDDTITNDSVDALAKKLDPGSDVMVLQGFTNTGLLDDALIRRAVETKVPVWVFPVHRRYEADHFFGLGAQGIVTSSFGYVSGRLPPVTSDAWASGVIVSGEMTKDPASERFALKWRASGELLLAAQGGQHFLLPGQICPLPKGGGRYQVDLEASLDSIPSDQRGGALHLAFGHDDDRYYENGLGLQNGYHAFLRADGSLGLASHSTGSSDAVPLASEMPTPAWTVGGWARLRLTVTPETVSISRVDGERSFTVETRDTRWRGGYLHLGRATADGVLVLRGLRVTT